MSCAENAVKPHLMVAKMIRSLACCGVEWSQSDVLKRVVPPAGHRHPNGIGNFFGPNFSLIFSLREQDQKQAEFGETCEIAALKWRKLPK